MEKEIKRLCMPSGPTSAKIAFVGEAPGEQEDRVGEPFIGRAGQLLNNLLRAAGITRSSCYITNVIRERPPANNIKKFIDLEKKTPTITPEFVKYQEQVIQEVKNTKANVVVLFGAIPLYAFLEYRGITKWRGSVIWCDKINKKVIPCIHPSAALRQYLYQYYIINDLQRAFDESQEAAYIEPVYNIHVQPTFDFAMSYMQDIINDKKGVAFDIEVINQEISCFSLAKTEHDCMCIAFTHKGHEVFSPPDEGRIMQQLARILETPDIPLLGQNLMFDTSFVLRKYGIKVSAKKIEDTMIAHAIVFPDFPKGLDFITANYTRQPYYKDEGKQYMKMGGSDLAFWRYNALDSLVVKAAMGGLHRDLDRTGNMETYKNQMALIEPLNFMYEKGMKIAHEKLEAYKGEAEEKIATLLEGFHKACGSAINPNSPKQLCEFFYLTRKYAPYKNRKTQALTVDEMALKRLSRKGSAEAKILIDYRKWKKLHSTSLNVTFDEDDRLRGSYNPVGTKQGRISSSKTIFGTGANLQNMPPEFKQFIIPDTDNLLFEFDLGQAENRVVAMIAPEALMIEAFETGKDVHSLTAGLIFDKRPDEISDEEGSSNIGSGRISERGWGKRANHGLNYGMSHNLFSLMYEIPLDEAKFIVEKYHQAYPGVRMYHRWVTGIMNKARSLTNVYGRTRVFRDRWGNDLLKVAYSFIPQSTVADHLNRFAIQPLYYDQETFNIICLLNTVHDSVYFQVHKKHSTKDIYNVLCAVKGSMETPLSWRGREFVIPADCAIHSNMSDKDKMFLPNTEDSMRLIDKYKGVTA